MALEGVVEVRLLLFAKSRELAGTSETTIIVPSNITGQKIVDTVLVAYPQLEILQGRFLISLNQEFVERDQSVSVQPGDEIAIIPPISGDGGNLVRISSEPINLSEVTDFVADSSAGGISIFMGTTRDHFKGMKVMQLQYEAYTAMAMKQMMQICRSTREKWPVCKIAIVHRTGIVPVKEPSVIIAASSEHRKEAIDAVSFAIDAVKSSTTIWKKELYAEGDGEWKENKECLWLPEKLQ